MTDLDPSKTDTEQRLAALEREVKTIHAQLADIREIISSALDAQFAANSRQSDVNDVIVDRIDRIDEKLTPTFLRVFPHHQNILSEIDSVLRSRRSNDGE